MAVRSIAAGGATSVQYLHPDHLGSIGQITDASQGWVQDLYFKPYGGVRWAQSGLLGPDTDSSTRRSYTGQYEEKSEWLGSLMHYKARYYSPFLHRFTQPDTIVPGRHDPQGHNRYLYARGNPINANDPGGHCSVSIATSVGTITFSVPLADCPDMIDLRISETSDGGTPSLAGQYTGPDVSRDSHTSLFGNAPDMPLSELPRYVGPDMPLPKIDESIPFDQTIPGIQTANPYGKRGSPEHRNKIDGEAATWAQNWAEGMGLSNPRLVTEMRVRTPLGVKPNRFADLAVLDQNLMPALYIQVGRANKDGRPVRRERDAIQDIWEHSDGVPIVFMPYAQPGI